MIGCKISGVDLQGKKVTGIVLDKVLALQAVEMKGPGQVGAGQKMPIALDAYVVFHNNRISLVPPAMISEVSLPDDTDIQDPQLRNLLS